MSDILTVQETSLTAIADEIRKKTGKKDKIKFPTGFVSEIDSIQTGGGSAPAEEVEEKDVNFFDYDGTLIASYTEAEAKALTTLPTPPEHSGLVFQGWNYTLEEVKANAEMADIGALYTTDDGATRLEIEVASEVRRDVHVAFAQSSTNGGLIDWGDGESERPTSYPGNITYTTHEYAATGTYIIKIFVDDDCAITLCGSPVSMMNPSDKTSNTCNYYMSMLKKIFLGDRISGITASAFKNALGLMEISMNQDISGIPNYAFAGSGINFIAIPRGVTDIEYNAFSECYSLRIVSLPATVKNIGNKAFYNDRLLERVNIRNVTNINDYMAYNCYNLKSLVFNEEMTFIGTYMCYQCFGLVNVKFLGSVKQIYNNAFFSCTSLRIMDFTNCISVPTLQNTNSFGSYSSDMEILVPAALVDEWRQATNWTALAKYIKGV